VRAVNVGGTKIFLRLFYSHHFKCRSYYARRQFFKTSGRAKQYK